jgi:glycosyltransferase involved in cell wall biosynthesis
LRCIERNNLELVLPAVHSLGKDFPIPWIGYAYDFQHRYYGNYFTDKDRLSRDSHFEAIFNDPEVTVVNSRSVASDAERFVYPIRSSISVLPFTPFLRSEWLKTDNGILERYGLVDSTPYFLISNQFWPHKNHRLACEAARVLRRKGADFILAGVDDKVYLGELNYHCPALVPVGEGLERGLEIKNSNAAGIYDGGLGLVKKFISSMEIMQELSAKAKRESEGEFSVSLKKTKHKR